MPSNHIWRRVRREDPGRNIFISTGGGATNTAVAFSHLGLHAGIISKVGNDDAADRIVRTLEQGGVDASAIVRSTEYSHRLLGDPDVLHRRAERCWSIAAQARICEPRTSTGTNSLRQNGYTCPRWPGTARHSSSRSPPSQRARRHPRSQPRRHTGKDGLKQLAPALEAAHVIYVNKREAYELAGVEQRQGHSDEMQALQSCMTLAVTSS